MLLKIRALTFIWALVHIEKANVLVLTGSDVLLAEISAINDVDEFFAALIFIWTLKSKVENILMLKYTKNAEFHRFVY